MRYNYRKSTCFQQQSQQYYFASTCTAYMMNSTQPSTGKWSSPPTTGPRPSPCAYFSFTAINSHQAVLFGGYQPGCGKLNDCHLMDFESMVCPVGFCNDLTMHDYATVNECTSMGGTEVPSDLVIGQ